MKTKLLFLNALLLISIISFSQTSVPSNVRTSPIQFLGWNAGIPGPLNIRNDFNQPIWFGTNNFRRMVIDNGNLGPAGGQIAMGNNLPGGFAPSARLHLHQTFNSRVVTKFTNATTGNLATDGFDVGYRTNLFAEINNWENTSMRLFTNNSLRMLINPDQTNLIGFTPYTVPSDGFVAIGGQLQPFSMLHLNKPVAGGIDDFGYRPWMRGGVTFTDNVDLGYVGIRPFFDNTGVYEDQNVIANKNEFVIAWSNNELSGVLGADDMAFRFTTGTIGGPNSSPHAIDVNNLTSAEDLDGRHIVRFTALGNMGLGPTFGEELPIYASPQSLAHLSREEKSDTYLQITNQKGTFQLMDDGLRIGITNNGTAHIRQQEDLPLIFYTNKLETARMEPGTPTTGAPNPGMMGIGDFTTPPNLINVVDAKLDIDGDLRIRQLTQDDTLNMVLVADPNDLNRVHWRDVNSFGLGNICGAGTNPLISNWEIPLNNNSFIFDGQLANDKVGIGTTCAPLAKFHVLDNTGNTGFINSLVQTTHSNGFSAAFGVVNTSTVVGSIAGVFVASSANKTHAIVVPNTGGNVGFGTISPNTTYRLEVFGHTNLNGNIDGAGTVNYVSDQIFKSNIDSINNALSIINQLTPRAYNMDTNNVYGMNFSGAKQYGFVAQEVEPILPELISNLTKDPVYDSLGNMVSQGLNYKSLNYNAFFAIIAKAMQEQQGNIDSLSDEISTQDSINNDLEGRLATLEACLIENNLCNGQARLNNNGDDEGKVIQLESLNAIILDQNIPNPFKEKTTINYTIPEDVVEAQLLFYDMNGRIIKQVDIAERGDGKMTVYGENLKNGIYTYSLIADGELISTKRMVKSK